MIYLLVLAILLIGVVFFDRRRGTRGYRVWLFVEWLTLVLLAGLRYKVGGDTIAYYDAFDRASTLSELSFSDIFDSNYNALWVLLTALCKTIYPKFVLFQLVHAVIVNTAFFTFFQRKVRSVFLAVFLYFVFYFFRYNTEVLRASLAVSVFLLSFGLLEQKRWIKYLICKMIAIGFHSEAAVMLLFPLVHILGRIRVNAATFILIISAAALLMSVNLLPVFSDIGSVSDKVGDSIDFYANQTELGKGITALGYIKIFFTTSIWLVVLYALKDTPQKVLRGFAYIAFVITALSFNYSNIFYRLLDFLQPVLIASICLALDIFTARRQILMKWIIYAVLIVMTVDLITYYLSGHIILFYPYSSVFNPVDYSEREIYFYSLFQQY